MRTWKEQDVVLQRLTRLKLVVRREIKHLRRVEDFLGKNNNSFLLFQSGRLQVNHDNLDLSVQFIKSQKISNSCRMSYAKIYSESVD